MYSVTGANTKWDIFSGQRKDIAGSGDNSFSQIFGSSLKGLLGDQGGIQGMLDRLSERFPNLAVKEATAEAGIEGADKALGEEEGDQVAVESAALAAMSGNQDLAKKIEEAISSFMNSAGTVPALAEGAYVQRSITITVTTIRFGSFQRDGDSGDLLAASELKTSLQDKLQELIERFFGKAANAGGTKSDADAEAKDETAATKETEAKTGNGYAFSGAMWSMELFYSSSYINSMAGNGQGSLSAETWSFSASYSSFNQLTGSILPQSLQNGLSSFGQGGPFTSLLSGMGMSYDGASQTADGYFMKLRESRNLIAELMELYGSRIKPKEVEATEVEETDAAEGAEAEPAPAEAAAVE